MTAQWRPQPGKLLEKVIKNAMKIHWIWRNLVIFVPKMAKSAQNAVTTATSSEKSLFYSKSDFLGSGILSMLTESGENGEFRLSRVRVGCSF